ncbi:hypothetical protein NFJ07_25595, partial [Arthrobacter sp. B2a2-09]|uniref:hypothetical protein n=1 Tax=Arthrobacter sp. B2a2-09 TaxID=2952822 RepID=UPI0022CD8DF3
MLPDKEARAAYMREYRKRRAAEGKPLRGPDTRERRQHKSRELKRKYGITIEQMEQMISEQEGRCKICSVELLF